jgi:hypothetical protein
MACEERVLVIERYRSDGSLDGVVVDLDPTVTREDAEAVPVFGYLPVNRLAMLTPYRRPIFTPL